jgi:DNA-3-methyladenine glycosylase II
MNELFEINTSDDSVKVISQNDLELGKLIDVIGGLSFVLDENYYEALVKKIVGQQLSVKAAGTIWGRVKSLCNSIEPEVIQTISEDDLRSVGISRPKIKYIRDLTEKVLSGELDLNVQPTLDDSDVIRSLTKVKGIGQWSAEMFLIFSLGRHNIFSFADVGLRRGIRWLYQIEDGEIPNFPNIEKWSPSKTIASLYLWEIVNRGYIYDFADINELQNRTT